MRLIYAAFILLLALMASANCQQTAKYFLDEGIALNGQGKYDEALKALDEAIRINPEYPVYWDNKGRLLRYLHRDAEADAAFTKAKEQGYEG